ncbi:hypothetical protein DVH24_004881 [Malus domestica]|uniref:Uncharacterized protein n=1 Tax=Malus domestica TaxID=3750 RepID=A0A498IG53_MALDO|nr:hypothetical protein DVH24_004881 [Malus domestica]
MSVALKIKELSILDYVSVEIGEVENGLYRLQSSHNFDSEISDKVPNKKFGNDSRLDSLNFWAKENRERTPILLPFQSNKNIKVHVCKIWIPKVIGKDNKFLAVSSVYWLMKG